ncbi:hypothetical protein [Glutamicibacter sp. AOP5-A2-18]|uniref:hypothetical protein n=1 Tax=Glutamicibacter sp. AOP5-A2-18 TaxID=3457656 RepID=UPI004033A123
MFQINEEFTNDTHTKSGRSEELGRDVQPGAVSGAELGDGPGVLEEPGGLSLGRSGGELQSRVRPGADDGASGTFSESAAERDVRGHADQQRDVQEGDRQSGLSEQVHPRRIRGGLGRSEDADAEGNGQNQSGSSGVPTDGGSSNNDRRITDTGSAPLQSASSEAVDEARPERSGPVPARYSGEPGLTAPRNERERVQFNLDALELVNTLNEENRWPTVDEQAVLARYASWGGASKVVEEFHPGWEEERARLKSLVGADIYWKLSATTLNAHSTPDAQIHHESFSNFGVPDPNHLPGRYPLHNHFINKSLQPTTPSPMVAVAR